MSFVRFLKKFPTIISLNTASVQFLTFYPDRDPLLSFLYLAVFSLFLYHSSCLSVYKLSSQFGLIVC